MHAQSTAPENSLCAFYNPSTSLGFSPPPKTDRTPDYPTHTLKRAAALHSKKRGLRPHGWTVALEDTSQVQQSEQSQGPEPST